MSKSNVEVAVGSVVVGLGSRRSREAGEARVLIGFSLFPCICTTVNTAQKIDS